MLDRLSVAVHNSPARRCREMFDALKLARDVFEDERKFARTLRVDTAYHSAHMHMCFGPYPKVSLAATILR